MSSFEDDNNSLSHPHNQPLHIEVMIHHKLIFWVLINNGAGLSIVFATLLRLLDYSEESINPHRKITIEAYDKVEWKFLGLVVFPLHVGPLERDVTF